MVSPYSFPRFLNAVAMALQTSATRPVSGSACRSRKYSAPMSSSDSQVARMPATAMRAMGTVCPVTAPNQHLVLSLIVFLLFRASMRGRSSPRRR